MRNTEIQILILAATAVLWLLIAFSYLILSHRDAPASAFDYDSFLVYEDSSSPGTKTVSQKAAYKQRTAHAEQIERPVHYDSLSNTYADQELHKWDPASATLRRKSRSKAGHNGTGVTSLTTKQVREMEEYANYGFNIQASRLLPLDRFIPDTRDIRCRSAELPDRLPDASVIITFYNEAPSALFRTITSVLNHSPRSLLKEVILVDDASDDTSLTQGLEKFLRQLTLDLKEVEVKLIKLNERSGLIKARLAGVEEAAAAVLVFLDSHCECMHGWLEPLLARVSGDRRRVVAPAIDSISWVNFAYHMTTSAKVGGFNWNLDYRWITPPVRPSPFQPNETPVIAGGLFAIDRKFFHQIGTYDTGMRIWGAENIEISVRVWTCGGSLEIHPCSHVGHVFREKNPYLDPKIADPIVRLNKNRFAAVWMDDYFNYYQAIRGGKGSEDEVSDVSERIALRKELRCKPFSWYLETIFPYSHYPEKGQVVHIGAIISADHKSCIDTNKYMLNVVSCSQTHSFKQKFTLQEEQLRSNLLCLRAYPASLKVSLENCGTEQSFRWHIVHHKVMSMANGKCLSLRSSKSGEKAVFLDSCANDNSCLTFEALDHYSS